MGRSGAFATKPTARRLLRVQISTDRNSAGTIQSTLREARLVAGRAQLWLISGGRLYLFSREESLAAFAANPGTYAQAGHPVNGLALRAVLIGLLIG